MANMQSSDHGLNRLTYVSSNNEVYKNWSIPPYIVDSCHHYSELHPISFYAVTVPRQQHAWDLRSRAFGLCPGASGSHPKVVEAITLQEDC